MIKLEHHRPEIAERIYSVFQASYTIEAQILKVTNFPPLKRTVAQFLTCSHDFFGFWKDDKIVAIIEIKSNNLVTSIESLVVDPNYFRQGLAQQLITFLFKHFQSEKFIVETGLDNKPALSLYKKFGFKEIQQWDTPLGIRKVKLEVQN